MNNYWNDLSNDLHAGVPTKEESESNMAMLWGSINEDSALVTYLKKCLAKNKDNLVLRETGIWFLSDDREKSVMAWFFTRWHNRVKWQKGKEFLK